MGGYEDDRGDAAKNSLSLLSALHEEARTVELRHFCVGQYNTKEVGEEDLRPEMPAAFGNKTAILKGERKSSIVLGRKRS